MHSTFAVHHYRGNRVGFWHVMAGWTQAGKTPFQYYKQSSHRGGNADPLVKGHRQEIPWPDPHSVQPNH